MALPYRPGLLFALSLALVLSPSPLRVLGSLEGDLRQRPCAAYIRRRIAEGGILEQFIDYDDRFQHFDVSRATTSEDVREMAEYFRQSFAVDVHAPEALDVIAREIDAWAIGAQHNGSVGCRVWPDPPIPYAGKRRAGACTRHQQSGSQLA